MYFTCRMSKLRVVPKLSRIKPDIEAMLVCHGWTSGCWKSKYRIDFQADKRKTLYPTFTEVLHMKKSKLLETIQDLPEEFSVDDLIERLIILQKIEEGQEQIKSGRFTTESEAKQKLSRWLK
jgi:hypothetical protein